MPALRSTLGGVYMIRLMIDDKKIEATESQTILEAARENGIHIPNFCYLKDVHSIGSCRMCVVEVEGVANLQASCITAVKEGMVVHTNTNQVRNARKVLFDLLMSDHNQNCLVCSRNGQCEFQALGERLQVREENPYIGAKSKADETDNLNPAIFRDLSKCVLCRRCITVCNEIQGVGALNAQNRGFVTFMGPTETFSLDKVNCTYCGQCTTVCPTGALQEVSSIDKVLEAINDPNKHVVGQTAPAVRAALGEEFGYEPGTLVTGKMVSALRKIGFDSVFDTNFTADLTILEEGTELLDRIQRKIHGEEVTLPMITSCSPGWINYIEHMYPEQLENLSTCKSPHMMLGALTKKYYGDEIGRSSKELYVVSVMPCTAKKYEITRDEMIGNVDAVLTTRELAKLIKIQGIDFRNLLDEDFDRPFGFSTGAADIFGTTGGVMEAALRTVYVLITGKELQENSLHFQSIMGLESIKKGVIVFEDTLPEFEALKGQRIYFAAASGLNSARTLLEEIKKGESPYTFIEIMACPGGCISGGGQPRMTDRHVREMRMQAIYKEDEGKAVRKSHENPYVQKLYEKYLGHPGSYISHELLHTTYYKKDKYKI